MRFKVVLLLFCLGEQFHEICASNDKKKITWDGETEYRVTYCKDGERNTDFAIRKTGDTQPNCPSSANTATEASKDCVVSALTLPANSLDKTVGLTLQQDKKPLQTDAENRVRLLECEDRFQWASSDKYNLAICRSGNWINPTDNCNEVFTPTKESTDIGGGFVLSYCKKEDDMYHFVVREASDTVPSCPDPPGPSDIVTTACSPPVAPADIPAESQDVNGGLTLVTLPSQGVKVIECILDYTWLSFETYRAAECIGGNWTPILDMCIADVQIPVNCSSVQDLGLTANRYYRLTPSKIPGQPMFWFYCDLTTSNGRWTLVARAKPATQQPLREHSGLPLGQERDILYFMKNEHLNFLDTWDDDYISLILRVDVESGGQTYRGFYSDFMIDSLLTLVSVGDYHGNIGDPMCRYVGQQFTEYNRHFWGSLNEPNANDTVVLFGSTNHWSDFQDVHIRLYVRTKYHDELLSCPPFLGFEPSWAESTSVQMPLERSLSTVIEYQCVGNKYFRSGPPNATDDQLTSGGTSACVLGDDNKLAWNNTDVYMPCLLVCPDDFMESLDGRLCHHFSTIKAPSITHASERCMALNSSLHWPSDAGQIAFAQANEEYYTAFDLRYDGSVTSDVDSEFFSQPSSNFLTNYDGTSAKMKDQLNQCVKAQLAGENAKLNAGNCYEENLYICSLPAQCQETFTMPSSERGCYKWNSFNASADSDPESNWTIFEAAQWCNLHAAALPVPLSMDMVGDLVALALDQMDSTLTCSMSLFLGFYNDNGDWNSLDLYDNITTAVTAWLGADPLPYRLLTVDEAGNTTLEAVDGTEDTFSGRVLCEQHGPTGCRLPGPSIEFSNSASVNQENNLHEPINTIFTYNCDPGYFVDGNQSVTVQNVTCKGQLGGWTPHYNCTKLPVCQNLEFPLPSSLMTLEDTNNLTSPFYDGGLISYKCHENMLTPDGLSEQKYKCLEDISSHKIDRQLMHVEFMYLIRGPATVQTLQNCTVCARQPSGVLTKVMPAEVVSIGSTMTVDCLFNHHLSLGVNTQEVMCLQDGWEEHSMIECYRACPLAPPVADSATLVMEDQVSDRQGTELVYTCVDGKHVAPTEKHPQITTSMKATCTTDHVWKLDRLEPGPIACIDITVFDPLVPGVGVEYDWDQYTRTVGHNITYTCNEASTLLLYNLEATVTVEAETDGWVPDIPPELLECHFVCSVAPPTPGENLLMGNTTVRIGENITYTCAEGLHVAPTEDLRNITTTMTATCTDDLVWETDRPNEINVTCINITVVDPYPRGLGVHWDWDGFTRTVGSNITYECTLGFAFLLFNEEQSLTVTATPDGWSPDVPLVLLQCSRLCEKTLTPAGLSMVSDDIHDILNRIEGVVFNFNCVNDTYMPATEEYPNVTTSTYATCRKTDGEWEKEFGPRPLDCYKLCLSEPPISFNATNDWDTWTRFQDTAITHTCDEDTLNNEFEPAWNVTCNGTHWTEVDPEIFGCSRGCFSEAPTVIGNASLQTDFPYAKNGESLNYTCPDGQFFRTGTNTVAVTCFNETWSDFPNSITCRDACPGPPPEPTGNATYNFTIDFTEGQAVLYECEHMFHLLGATSFVALCKGSKWSINAVPLCLPITTPGPSTVAPHVLDIPNEFDLHYKFTSSNFESEIHASFGDVNAVDDNFETTTGPFGFGSATALRSVTQQCMKKVAFTGTGENCFANPIFCNDGISFSIWVRPYAFGNIMEGITPETEEYQYIMSTGGDTEGHPGFAIMHQEFWLVAVVSTGDMYWKVSVTNPIESKIWNNVAVIWHKDTGLKLLVNTTVIGTKFYSEAVTNPQLPLDPAELIIGCHKDSSNEEYRGYNNADFDEFAIWLRVLEGPEINYLNGGYNETDTSMTPAMLASVIENVDLTSPEQRDAAIAIMAKVSDSLNNEAPSEPTASSAQGVSSTASSPLFQSTTPQWTTESVDNMKNMYVVIEKMLRPDNLLNVQEIADTKSGMAITSAIDNLLMPSNTMSWRGVQEQCDEAGVMQIAQMYREYIDQALLVTRYPNGTEPFCTTMSTHNMLDQICMMRIEDLQNQGRMYEKPRYNTPDFERYLDEWETPYDRSAFDTTIFRDPRCDKRAVGIHITVYDTIASVVHTGVNPSVIDPNTQHAIDSRILSYTLVVQPAYTSDDEVDTSEPRCIPDPEYLQMYPVRIKLEHETPILALRTILFHEDLLDSDIEVRRCVKWNADLSDFGSWDSTGCVTMETTAHYTKCACDDFGVFAIMADKIEDISVPDDPSWLTTVKFIFYIISIVAIIIYIVVVTLSGDLKDQFHLMGMNMSVAILCGSIAMIVTDLPSVRSDRHTCTAFGMLIHFFYSATGLWSLTLGHASFKAITAGVIGGRLKSYMFLSWGGALALSGLPFVDDWRELGTDPRCFIAWDDGVKMIFFFPQILFVGGGLFCAIVILCNLSAPALRKENLIEDYGSFCRGTAFLNIVIALTWTFGLLAYVRFDGMDTNFYPIFQVLNSLCGLLLLLFIGIGSNRFRMFLAGQAKKRRQMIKSSAFGLPDQAEDSSQQEAGPIPPTEEPLVPISKEGKKEKKKKGKKGKKK